MIRTRTSRRDVGWTWTRPYPAPARSPAPLHACSAQQRRGKLAPQSSKLASLNPRAAADPRSRARRRALLSRNSRKLQIHFRNVRHERYATGTFAFSAFTRKFVIFILCGKDDQWMNYWSLCVDFRSGFFKVVCSIFEFFGFWKVWTFARSLRGSVDPAIWI